jgi:hypothetical protein
MIHNGDYSVIKKAWLWLLDTFFPFRDTICCGCERRIGLSGYDIITKKDGTKGRLHKGILCRTYYQALNQPKEEWS